MHVVCYSGGHSSGRVAVAVTRRFGASQTILLNHDINPNVEDADIKRFKTELASKLGLVVTYANNPNFAAKDQFDIAVENDAFKTSHENVICTSRLKTEPFKKWLAAMHSNYTRTGDRKFLVECVYYGFDANETTRITRRSSIMAVMGYPTDYPIAQQWSECPSSTEEVGVKPPLTYGTFKHANCTGCIKGGLQHWYAVYVTRPDIWNKAKAAEESIGYSIIKSGYLSEYEPRFKMMQAHKVVPTEHVDPRTFFAQIRKLGISDDSETNKPCECVI